jgi:single-strand DNA-binding protein
MINKIILVGNVGADPDYHLFDNDSGVTNFSLATSESWTKDGQKQEKTTWHNCKAFGSLALIISKYVKKGGLLYIEGRIENRSYEKDGVTKYITEVVVNQMQMLSKKDEAEFTG